MTLNIRLTYLLILFTLFFSNLFSQEYEGKNLVDTKLYVDSKYFFKPFKVALKFKIADMWHLYWKNPGDAGLKPTITFSTNKGYQVKHEEFPTPKKFLSSGIVGYGYSKELILIGTVTPTKDVIKGEKFFLNANVKWLVCKDVCIPGNTTLKITEDDITAAFVKESREVITKGMSKLPIPINKSKYTINNVQIKDLSEIDAISISFNVGNSEDHLQNFFPLKQKGFSINNEDIKIEGNSIKYSLNKSSKSQGIKELLGFSGIIKIDNQGYFIEEKNKLYFANINNKNLYVKGKEEEQSSNKTSALFILNMILLAFLGGLILNAMPCVLPALAIKILSFAQHNDKDSRSSFKHGLWFSFGVLVSFWILAFFVVFLKVAGSQIGWGFQFQSPYFVLTMLAVVWIFGLNLFGVFDIKGVSFSGKVSNTLSKGGYVGAFSNGVLASVLATPCTAPFLSIALGFAFSQSSLIIVLIFTSIALGLSTPYLILTLNPKLLAFIPKPGEWMNKFKQFMGFLLAITAIWLSTVFYSQVGENAYTAMLVWVLFLSIACWCLGSYVDITSTNLRKSVIWVTSILIIFLGTYVSFSLITPLTSIVSKDKQNVVNGEEKVKFTEEYVKDEVNKGQIVFLDFTADWCFTCKVNEKIVLQSENVKQTMKMLNVKEIIADWTNYNPEISTFLKKFNRAGVPFYVVYPSNQYESPIVLPELITEDIVIEALQSASEKKASFVH